MALIKLFVHVETSFQKYMLTVIILLLDYLTKKSMPFLLSFNCLYTMIKKIGWYIKYTENFVPFSDHEVAGLAKPALGWFWTKKMPTAIPENPGNNHLILHQQRWNHIVTQYNPNVFVPLWPCQENPLEKVEA